MMRLRRMLIIAGAIGALAAPSAWATGKSTYTPGYSGGAHYDMTQCSTPTSNAICPPPTGSADASTAAMTAAATIDRSQGPAASGIEHNERQQYFYQSFRLSKPTTSITAALSFAGVSAKVSASSNDGAADAGVELLARITDSGCPAPTYDCGATMASTRSLVATQDVRLGVPGTGPGGTNATPNQTLTVTLQSADGSPLPSGRITITGMLDALTQLSDASCTSSCVASAPHAGSAAASGAATLTQIELTQS